MNYLAHAYLSFGNPPILVGNMISDFIKGKKQYEYESFIQKGIKLHRSIDKFTDDHPLTKQMKNIFKPVYGLYAGAFADIVYDYFLANDSKEFSSPVALKQFTSDTYEVLENHIDSTPINFKQIFPHMKTHDWLYNYRFEWGIQKSFTGMTNKAKYMSESETAFRIFENNIPFLQPYYDEFFPLLKTHANSTLEELLYSG